MRMWNVDPKLLCRNHLLGEHVEMHMFIGCLKKNINLSGYIKKGLVEVHNIKKRHKQLVDEMIKRNYIHNSDIKDDVKLYCKGKINKQKNIVELINRCKKCYVRIWNYGQIPYPIRINKPFSKYDEIGKDIDLNIHHYIIN